MKRKAAPTESEILSEIRSIYQDLAERPIQRNCTLQTECCRFHLTGKTPLLTAGEAFVAAKAIRSAGRTSMPESPDGSCPMLDQRTARCMIYANRPFACRTHFCEGAGGPLARKDVLDLIRRLEVVDASMNGKGAVNITSAVREQLHSLSGRTHRR